MEGENKICTKCHLEIKEDHWWEWNQWDGYFHHNCEYPTEPPTEEIGRLAEQ
jgi:hypothetical protein